MLINHVSNNYNYPQVKYQPQVKKNELSFCGGGEVLGAGAKSKFFAGLKKSFKPVLNYYDKKVESLAHRIGKALDTKFAYRLIQKTKKCEGLFNHLMTTGSVVLSSLYIFKTLTNKKLDEKKRNTLAINQGIVFGLSTVMCYATDAKMNSWMDKFAKKFEAVNFERATKNDAKKLLLSADQAKGFNHLDLTKLNKCVKGVGVAGKIIIFDTIYRFIAPVFVTPIANKLGDKYNATH